MEKIYADYKLDDSKDMFVYTPEGTEFTFPFDDGFNENHNPVTITDPISNKNYLVIFDE
mgnify:CR=1 FL=1